MRKRSGGFEPLHRLLAAQSRQLGVWVAYVATGFASDVADRRTAAE